MCMCVCEYVCMCVCIYVCASVLCLLCMSERVYMRERKRVCKYEYVCMYVCYRRRVKMSDPIWLV